MYVDAFLAWFRANGVPSGYSILANTDIPEDATVVSCPFSLAITPQVAKKSLVKLLKGENVLEGWSERQLLYVYLCFHGIVPVDTHAEYDLAQKPCLDTLPLYGATGDQERSWKAEWQVCQGAVAQVNEEWGKALTWDAYLTTSTYLSSRAFPSTVLSSTPTLQSTPDSHPVHRIPQPRSSYPRILGRLNDLFYSRQLSVIADIKDSISIVLDRNTRSGGELVNNYGAKPNSELILGYGFALPSNLEDTIVLAIGDPRETDAGLWEVDVWEVVLGKVKSATQGEDGINNDATRESQPTGGDDDDDEVTPVYEDKLEAARMLAELVETLLDWCEESCCHETRGQRDTLESLLKFAMQKETQAVEEAREAGVKLLFK
ncbi:hypothetical protein BDV98DRAFT_612202 [Pterulicium gracile]|uniref:SET domain-containing protein n=1 Tax=Pterulicium gracile TaxID=1884261 RepID=A0A5C3QKI4_9AGAR|nr:hypothetical protein BDV98DRAFT_612202 [Pterula gracilis]